MSKSSLALTTSQLINTHKIILLLNLIHAFIFWQYPHKIWQEFIFAALYIFIFYLHVRLYFDVKIFKEFANGMLSLERFDESLRTLGLVKQISFKDKKSFIQRDMTSRCKGAMRLWFMLISVSCAAVVYTLCLKWIV
ncbi:hypothetical protein [Campylobacter sp.]|uniref:hypothetical protein n=1 Tax=Campylobacter sp. TaxID=205 RepID=UPI0026FBF4F8|nr:hypothetical protein [Campylobacter sp.]